MEESAPLLHDEPLLADETAKAEPLEHANVQRALVYVLFFVLGAITLLSWNASTVTSAFYRQRLGASIFRDSYMSYLSLVGSGSNLFFLWCANRTQQQSKPSRRILASIALITLVQLIFAITAWSDAFNGNTYFALLMLLSLMGSLGTSYLQNASVALSSYFAPINTQAIFSGQGAIGLAVSVIQFMAAYGSINRTTTADPQGSEDGIQQSATIFFSLATLFAFSGLIIHLSLTKLPYYRSKLAQATQVHESTKMHVSFRTVERKVRSLGLAVFFVFVVTLSLFPSITSSILSNDIDPAPGSITSNALFIPLSFIVFNAGDWIGRTLPSYPPLAIVKVRVLVTASVARLAFVPLFLMCNVVMSDGSQSSIAFIGSDVAYMVILLLFAISNGHTSTCILISGVSRKSLSPEEKELAGSILIFYLASGLIAGSIASFASRAAVCQCNPFTS